MDTWLHTDLHTIPHVLILEADRQDQVAVEWDLQPQEAQQEWVVEIDNLVIEDKMLTKVKKKFLKNLGIKNKNYIFALSN